MNDRVIFDEAPDEAADDGFGPADAATTAASYTYINESGLPDDDVYGALKRSREIASVIEKWSQSLSSGQSSAPTLDLFNRARWSNKSHFFADVSRSCWAVENDEVLSTLGDVVEGLMFQKC